jgi:hypothetical protein
MGACGESPERDEAARVAAALVGLVCDGDTEGAQVLLANRSHQLLAQAATDLARWIVDCVDGDRDEFRAGISRMLLHFATRD